MSTNSSKANGVRSIASTSSEENMASAQQTLEERYGRGWLQSLLLRRAAVRYLELMKHGASKDEAIEASIQNRPLEFFEMRRNSIPADEATEALKKVSDSNFYIQLRKKISHTQALYFAKNFTDRNLPELNLLLDAGIRFDLCTKIIGKYKATDYVRLKNADISEREIEQVLAKVKNITNYLDLRNALHSHVAAMGVLAHEKEYEIFLQASQNISEAVDAVSKGLNPDQYELLRLARMSHDNAIAFMQNPEPID